MALNIRGEEHLLFEYERMMRLPGVTGIMVQPMLKDRNYSWELNMRIVSAMWYFAGWVESSWRYERCVLWFGSVVIR